VSDDLDDNIRDKLVAATKGIVGIVPWAGGLLGELIGQVIPKQRHDRIVTYIRILNDRIETLEVDVVKNILDNPEKIGLIEDGGYQAAQSTSTNRIRQIAEAVFNGLSEEDSQIVRRKRILKIFGEIDDDELVLLNAYAISSGRGMRDPEVEAAWQATNQPQPTHLQSQQSEIENRKLFELGRSRLLNLGLLEQAFSRVKKGEIPEFDDKTGTIKGRVQISYLGRMLIKEIGQSLDMIS
jgi:hypothetical protein